MNTRQSIFVLVLFLLLAPGCGPNFHDMYLRMPEQDKDLYANSRQFLTETQREKFLQLETSEERTAFVEKLKVGERLDRFPPHVRSAIQAARVVPGMTTEAVLLSWGKPAEIDRRDVDDVPAECWIYTRSGESGLLTTHKIYFLRQIVTEVIVE